jgi:hypothetical protein
MERIKATQQKIQGPMLKEPEIHAVGKSIWISGTVTAVIILLLFNKMDLWGSCMCFPLPIWIIFCNINFLVELANVASKLGNLNVYIPQNVSQMSGGYLLSYLECKMLCKQGLWSLPCLIALSWNSLIFGMSSCCHDYSTWEQHHLCCVIKVCSMIVISSGTPTPYIHTSSNQKVSSLTSRVTRFVDLHDHAIEFHTTISVAVWLVNQCDVIQLYI